MHENQTVRSISLPHFILRLSSSSCWFCSTVACAFPLARPVALLCATICIVATAAVAARLLRPPTAFPAAPPPPTTSAASTTPAASSPLPAVAETHTSMAASSPTTGSDSPAKPPASQPPSRPPARVAGAGVRLEQGTLHGESHGTEAASPAMAAGSEITEDVAGGDGKGGCERSTNVEEPPLPGEGGADTFEPTYTPLVEVAATTFDSASAVVSPLTVPPATRSPTPHSTLRHRVSDPERTGAEDDGTGGSLGIAHGGADSSIEAGGGTVCGTISENAGSGVGIRRGVVGGGEQLVGRLRLTERVLGRLHID